jgi:accessory gene regulator protein AgrB
MKSSSLSIGLVILGIVFVIIAVLYAFGVLQLFASTSSGPHYKHAILFAVLAVASFVAANFARPKTA